MGKFAAKIVKSVKGLDMCLALFAYYLVVVGILWSVDALATWAWAALGD